MRRRSRIILGLNSGTSADGVDAAACEITGRGLRMCVRVIGHLARRYPPDLRRRILAVMAPAATHTEEICRLQSEIGRVFARTAASAVKRFGLKRLDLIGSHGQTICHLPPRTLNVLRKPRRGRAAHSQVAGSLQIGDASIIAAELGAPVVSQFRQADMAVGGQGAPLVPWTDYVLFNDVRRSRVVQNIGGIANLTWLPAGGTVDDVTAFDTGPGNMLIDALVAHFTQGNQSYDRSGSLARKGEVHEDLLKHMATHPYLLELPPKSCGREEFGQKWMRTLLERFKRRRISIADWIATATRFTATTIASHYVLFLDSADGRAMPADEIILCGGGARNKTLVSELKSAVTFDGHFERVRFTTTDDYGIPIQAKECVSFAMLAVARMEGIAANLPQVTGARRRVILGQVCDPG